MDDPAFRAASTKAIVHAPAKINLSLHVVGRRADGYHLLDGLVVFAGIADRLIISPSDEDRLAVGGPMASKLAGGVNILTRTLAFARAAAERRGLRIGPLALDLEKHLPVAAGLGGGSSDAAALLRWLSARHPELGSDLSACAGLGADVPMCLTAAPCRIGGIGDVVEPLTRFPALPMVLANPGVAVETPAVFAALATRSNTPPPPVPEAGFDSPSEIVDYLAGCRNDLEAPAIMIAPAIAEALDDLRMSGAAFARMSGSGATVFGIFPSDAAAGAAAERLKAARPEWWIAATRSAGTEELQA